MRTKGLVVPHSPANALLVGLDPAGGLLAASFSCAGLRLAYPNSLFSS